MPLILYMEAFVLPAGTLTNMACGEVESQRVTRSKASRKSVGEEEQVNPRKKVLLGKMMMSLKISRGLVMRRVEESLVGMV